MGMAGKDGTMSPDERKTRPDEGSNTYVAPEIVTYTPEDFLALLGPAQGYGGHHPPVGGRGFGRLRRLFPGMR
ncbi:MAG: hypothetical protein D6718_05175 [Acidobacteria bacterium]|nr:MAG: hypothetical protein D6718_05175 [Acidobacteriota bacterium]